MSDEPRLVPGAPGGGVDASALPGHAFGPKEPSWWATVGFMVIEGTTLVVCLATYLYLRRHFDAYPPAGHARPDLLAPALGMVLMLVSLLPARGLQRAARDHDRAAILRSLAVLLALEVVILGVRALELAGLHVRWDSNAYGSAAWFTVGFHTLLLLVNFVESAAIAAIFALRKQEPKHYGDADDDAIYWYFIVGSWVPIYLIVLLGPWLGG